MNKIINSDDIKKQINEISNLFNSGVIEDIARFTGFVERTSKITGVIFLSIFVLGLNLYEKPTLQQLIGLLKNIVPDLEITKEGFQQRINEHAVQFFEYMLSQAINISTKEIDLKLISHFNRVLILDSTVIELPKELSKLFKGKGGSASASSVKIQFCYDLKLGKFFYLIQDGVSSDVKYDNNFIDKLEENDLIIKDLGYFNPQVFIDTSMKGAYYLSRLKSDTNVYIKNEKDEIEVLNMEKFLSQIDSIKEIEIYIKKDKQLTKTRLVAEKVPEDVKNTRLRKLNRNCQKEGRKPKEITKLFQSYNLFISNVPKDLLSMNDFRKLYVLRWQIELIFKSWKSNFNLDKVSGIKPERIKCMLYARLILIFISTKIIFQIRNIYWLETGKEISEFKASKHLLLIFPEILKVVIKKQATKKIISILNNAIEFIVKNCTKINQKDSVYPLDLLNSLTLASPI